MNVDVIIVGGGTAGVVAAIQAGRAGARTLLVEKSGMLGGTMTAGGVNNPGLFFAGSRQVIAGIGWELVTRCLAESGQSVPAAVADPDKEFWQRHIPIDRFIYAMLCDEAVEASGAELLFHTMIAALTPLPESRGWSVTLCTKSGLVACEARVVIDCTGDACATALAGFPLHIPEETQPATLGCVATGYDYATLDIAAINAACESEVRAGRLRHTDSTYAKGKAEVGHWLRRAGQNASHVESANARDSAGRTRLELDSRRALLRLYRFLRTQPGLEKIRFEHVAPECGVRETVTIVGKGTVTVDDYRSGRLWDDALCYACYPIDLHVPTGHGSRVEPLAEGVVPTVPRAALLPIGSRDFLVAGRCVSSDRLANSALRVQATSMAVGQAAGAMGAMAVATGVAIEDLPMADIDAMLRTHGAIVPVRRS